MTHIKSKNQSKVYKSMPVRIQTAVSPTFLGHFTPSRCLCWAFCTYFLSEINSVCLWLTELTFLFPFKSFRDKQNLQRWFFGTLSLPTPWISGILIKVIFLFYYLWACNLFCKFQAAVLSAFSNMSLLIFQMGLNTDFLRPFDSTTAPGTCWHLYCGLSVPAKKAFPRQSHLRHKN